MRKKSSVIGSFANNDIDHVELSGVEHEPFGFGLKKALLNYMHAACFDFPLQKWFDFKVAKTTVPPDTIRKAVNEPELLPSAPNSKVVWIGKEPRIERQTRSKKGAQWEVLIISFPTRKGEVSIQVEPAKGEWLARLLPKIGLQNPRPWTLQQVQEDYEHAGLEDFELFWDNKPVNGLHKAGLLRL